MKHIFKQSHSKRVFSLSMILLFSISCADRNRDNPFDPGGDLNLFITVLSENRTVSLSWNLPGIDELTGFNVYRKLEGTDSSFVLIGSNIPASQNSYSDTNVQYEQKYYYYITAIGKGIESNPSAIVNIIPGPGLVWIVDKKGYQIVKTTYDLEHTIFRYFTDWPPEDMDVDPQNRTGGIVFPSAGHFEFIDLDDGSLLFEGNDINYPYRISCDRASGMFWIIDSSGFLYEVDPIDGVIFLRSNFLRKPVEISIDQTNINVVDTGLKQIIRFNRGGAISEVIEQVQGRPLALPQHFIFDDINQRLWLSEDFEENDFIFSRKAGEDFYRVDSTENISDLALSGSGGLWYINYAGRNSTVVQLSGDGERQIELTGFWSPFDIHVNPYDNTLLIAITGSGRVEHYSSQNQFIGISSILNFPVKVTVQ